MEGPIPGVRTTRDPLASQLVEALEAIQLDERELYVILNAPKIKNHGENYIQALSLNKLYRCELRICGAACDSYRQWSLMLPDEIGLAGTPEKNQPNWITGYYCDLTTTTDAFMAFIGDSSSLPRFEGWVWVDITDFVDERRRNWSGRYGRV